MMSEQTIADLYAAYLHAQAARDNAETNLMLAYRLGAEAADLVASHQRVQDLQDAEMEAGARWREARASQGAAA